jgi:4-hydroxy-3-polyprenylbenzoate decarboxylase
MQIFDKCTTGMHWHRHKTGARHYDLLKEMIASGNKTATDSHLPLAVTLGGDPLYTYCATAPLPEGIDEYLLAGFLRHKSVMMTNCITQPLQIPSDCDFVIEGYVDVEEAKVMEGPFGDHTGFYSLADLYPLFHVTCITHRRNAVYPATIVGIPPMEDKFIALATEKIFLSPIRFAIAPEIEDLYLPEEGVGHNFAVVKFKKSYPGQGHKVASALWGAGQMMFNKFILLISQDIDIRDKKALLEAIKTHYLPSRDTLITKGPLDILDHTAPVCGYGGKISIDATWKFPEEKGNSEVTQPCEIIILFDSKTSKLSECSYEDLWRLGSNCDPSRDCSIEGNKLILNAKTKKGIAGFNREWPDEVRF